MNFKEKTQELEKEHQENGSDTLRFEIISTELRWMIRDYCERKGVEMVCVRELDKEIEKPHFNALNRQNNPFLQRDDINFQLNQTGGKTNGKPIASR